MPTATLVFPQHTAVSNRIGLTINGTGIHHAPNFTFHIANGSTWEDRGEYMEARKDGLLQAVIKK